MWFLEIEAGAQWLIVTASLCQMHAGIAAAFRGSRCGDCRLWKDHVSRSAQGWFCLSMPLSARGECNCYCDSWQLLWIVLQFDSFFLQAFVLKTKVMSNDWLFLWPSGISGDQCELVCFYVGKIRSCTSIHISPLHLFLKLLWLLQWWC